MSRLFKTVPDTLPTLAPMSEAKLVARAVAPLPEIINAIEPSQLGNRTPCADWDVRTLVNHLLFWGPPQVGAGRKELIPPPGDSEHEANLTSGDWATALTNHFDSLATAWGEPSAWEGNTRLDGSSEMPAAVIGGMVVGEVVVHGWDLARATGQQPQWDPELLDYLLQEATGMAEQARQMGLFGPEVTVPASASTVDRILGITGRDPDWAP
jgi:uncharacterized protein (TIGR03086 family)